MRYPTLEERVLLRNGIFNDDYPVLYEDELYIDEAKLLRRLARSVRRSKRSMRRQQPTSFSPSFSGMFKHAAKVGRRAGEAMGIIEPEPRGLRKLSRKIKDVLGKPKPPPPSLSHRAIRRGRRVIRNIKQDVKFYKSKYFPKKNPPKRKSKIMRIPGTRVYVDRNAYKE